MVTPSILQGVKAYAFKQAHITRAMAARCAADWISELAKARIRPPWAVNYKCNSSNRKSSVGDVTGDLEQEFIEESEVMNMEMLDSDSESDDGGDSDSFEFDD